MSYPAVMLRHATVPDQRTTIYVIGETRAVLEGWTSEDVPRMVGDEEPLEVFEGELLARGEDRVYVRTWAGEYTGGDTGGLEFLTRFDTRAPTEAHQLDVGIGFEDTTEPLETRIIPGVSSSTTSTTAPTGSALLLLPVLGLGWARRRRPAGSPAGRAARAS
jgi:MYXO-CTERM domain-containing protein